MSVKVSAYDVNAGWTSLLDHFNVDVNGTSRSDDAVSFTGARAAYTTTYVASLSTAAFHCGASGPSCWEGQASYFGSGVRPEWPKSTAQWIESGGRVLGDGGSQPHPHYLSGERCKLPRRGPGGVPAAKRFLAF